MKDFDIITLRQRPELKDRAAEWFHGKWGVPPEAYLECMEDYLEKRQEGPVPQHLRCLYGGKVPLPRHCRQAAGHGGGGPEVQGNIPCIPAHGPHRFL